MSPKEADKNQEHKITLNLIVQGTGVAVEANSSQPLKSLIGKALEKASVAAGDLKNWYFSDESGKELDAEKSIKALGLIGGQAILLNQRAGAAG